MKIAHIINPVKVPSSSDLFYAQPITFETMRAAREFAGENLEISLFTAQYHEDHDIIPTYFQKTPDLTRSVLDIAQFKKPRKLPLLADILDCLYEQSDCEYFIYTNVDIALMPHFYLSMKVLVENGLDSFVINRRTISDRYKSIEEIPTMYSEYGLEHAGYDCFVFPRRVYKSFQLGNSIIGAPWIGKILLWNLIANSTEFRVLRNEHLTFHIGDDKNWQNPELEDYRLHNKVEASTVKKYLENEIGSFNEHPLLERWHSDLNPEHTKLMSKVIRRSIKLFRSRLFD